MLQHVDNRAEFVELRDGQAALCAGNGRANCTGRAGRFDCRGAQVEDSLTELTPVGAVPVDRDRPGEGRGVVGVQLRRIVAVWLIVHRNTRDGAVCGKARGPRDGHGGHICLPADDEDLTFVFDHEGLLFGLTGGGLGALEFKPGGGHKLRHAGVGFVKRHDVLDAGGGIVVVHAAVGVAVIVAGTRLGGGHEVKHIRAVVAPRAPAIAACAVVANPDVIVDDLDFRDGDVRAGGQATNDVAIFDDGTGTNHQVLRPGIRPHVADVGQFHVLCGDGGEAENQQQNHDKGGEFLQHGDLSFQTEQRYR